MLVSPNLPWCRPDNYRLIAALSLLQAIVVLLPGLFYFHGLWLGSAVCAMLYFGLFSVRRLLLIMLGLCIALPFSLHIILTLPGGVRLEEALLIAGALFAFIEVVYRRSGQIRTSYLDRPVGLFLVIALLSCLIGLWHGNSPSVILRDARFPLYFSAVFLVVNFVERRHILTLFAPLLLVAAAIVGLEYILEFVGAIDLSTGTRFVRVARVQGVSLPLALLFGINILIFAPKQYNRALLITLMLPVGLAFVLTVGRGMWVSFAIGLAVTAWLHYLDQPSHRRSATRALMTMGLVITGLVVLAFLFQRFTGAAVGAHALERSLTFVDTARDPHFLGRLFSYSIALEAIAKHPILGAGQGAELTFPVFDFEDNKLNIVTSWTLDSLYLTLLLKMGIIGLLAFVWLAWRSLRLAFALFRRCDDPGLRAFGGGVLANLFAQATLGLSDGSMLNSRFAAVYAIILGLLATTSGKERVATESGPLT